jgi:hypothetical protein
VGHLRYAVFEITVQALGEIVNTPLSRMKVHRSAGGPEWDGDDDGEVYDDEESLTPPFLFVGLEVKPRPGEPVRDGTNGATAIPQIRL